MQNAQSLCLDIHDKNYIPICIQGIASHISKNNFNDIKKTKQMCDNTVTEYRDKCIQGAIESLTRFVSEEKGKEFCEMWSGNYSDQCFSRINSLLENRYG